MKITVLFASPHADGHTARLLQRFLAGFPQPAETDFWDCYALAPLPCTDCGACAATGTCRLHELDALFRSCAQCDALIIASPVYNYSVPSPLKAVFDRAQPYYHKNFRGVRAPTDPARRGYLLLTAGRSGKDAFDIIKKQAGIFFQNFNITYSGEQCIPGTDA